MDSEQGRGGVSGETERDVDTVPEVRTRWPGPGRRQRTEREAWYLKDVSNVDPARLGKQRGAGLNKGLESRPRTGQAWALVTWAGSLECPRAGFAPGAFPNPGRGWSILRRWSASAQQPLGDTRGPFTDPSIHRGEGRRKPVTVMAMDPGEQDGRSGCGVSWFPSVCVPGAEAEDFPVGRSGGPKGDSSNLPQAPILAHTPALARSGEDQAPSRRGCRVPRAIQQSSEQASSSLRQGSGSPALGSPTSVWAAEFLTKPPRAHSLEPGQGLTGTGTLSNHSEPGSLGEPGWRSAAQPEALSTLRLCQQSPASWVVPAAWLGSPEVWSQLGVVEHTCNPSTLGG